jgi:hypothetical protein
MSALRASALPPEVGSGERDDRPGPACYRRGSSASGFGEPGQSNGARTRRGSRGSALAEVAQFDALGKADIRAGAPCATLPLFLPAPHGEKLKSGRAWRAALLFAKVPA